MKKLLAVVLFVLLAAGTAFAWDVKVIDEATNLNNLHDSVRPIGHAGSGYGRIDGAKRAIGYGWIIRDDAVNAPDNQANIWAANYTGANYIADKLAILQLVGRGLALQQGEAGAVWRGVPQDHRRVRSNGGFFVPNPLETTRRLVRMASMTPVEEANGYFNTNTNTANETADAARYGFVIPRVWARAVANRLYPTNPGTNVLTGEHGQEAMTGVFVWSADHSDVRNAAVNSELRMVGTVLDGANNTVDAPNALGSVDTVAVMVQLDNNLYRGMKVEDIKVIKVKTAAGTGSHVFTRVDSASQVRGGTFAIVHRNSGAVRDVVLGGSEIIAAGSRTGADPEWQTMRYYALIGVKKGTEFDAAASTANIVADPALIVGTRPFVKTPNFSSPLPTGLFGRYGWREGDRDSYGQAVPAFRAGEGYRDTTLAAMTTWNVMSFVSDAVVTRYGFDPANVYKLPAVRAFDVPTGKTAVVMFSVRIGDGPMELPAARFYGLTPADLRVIDVRSDVAPDTMTEFTLASTIAELADGKFAVLKPNAFDGQMQDVVPANETFVAGTNYFIALAVKDQGAFDVTRQTLSNNESYFSPAFVVTGEIPGPTPDPTPDPSPTPDPTPNPSSSSGGGCSVGGFAPATLILLAPLFLLLKK